MSEARPSTATDGATRQAPTRGTWPALRRFWPFVRPHKRWLWIGLVMIPVVAALVEAIYQATGTRFYHLPVTATDIQKAIQ